MSKFSYLAHCLKNVFQRPLCPYCGSEAHTQVDRKYLVSRLLRCDACRLQYRVPVDTEQANVAFYNESYRQGFTTAVLSPEDLARHCQANFADTDRNFDRYCAILDIFVARGAKLFDFGCSWGYGAYQYKTFGYDVQAFEVARDRAAIARTLGIDVLPVEDAAPAAFDVVASTHVIEHLPNPKVLADAAGRLLKPAGTLFIACPNGGAAYRARAPVAWHKSWGEVHPLMITAEFLQTLLADYACCVFTDLTRPDDLRRWDRASNAVMDLAGEELFCIAQRRT